MSLKTDEHDSTLPTVGIHAAAFEPYSAIETDDEALIIYDERNEDAWIQSDIWAAGVTVG